MMGFEEFPPQMEIDYIAPQDVSDFIGDDDVFITNRFERLEENSELTGVFNIAVLVLRPGLVSKSRTLLR
jgi:hypothetical protein